MRIGLVNEFFPPFAPGGAEWSMFALAKGLVERGHHVVVITPNYGAPPFEMIEGIRVCRFQFPKKMNHGRAFPSFFWYANPIFYAYSAYRIFELSKKEKLELLHVQNKYSLAGSFIAGRLLNIPVLCSIRDTSNICRIAVCLQRSETVPSDCGLCKLIFECSDEYYQNYYPVKSTWRYIKNKIAQLYFWFSVRSRRFILRRIDGIIGVSRGIIKVHETAQVFGKNHPPMESVHNFIDKGIMEMIRNPETARKGYRIHGKKMVLFIGKFSRGKGVPDFVRAIDLLDRKTALDETDVVMIGSGDLPPFLNSKIIILKDLPHRDTLMILKLCNVVVVPSATPEALSRVILEALVAGKPVVGTRVGGTPEAVIDGKNGILVSRHDPEALARAIETILSDDALAAMMGAASKKIGDEKFSKAIVIPQIEALYKEHIRNKKACLL